MVRRRAANYGFFSDGAAGIVVAGAGVNVGVAGAAVVLGVVDEGAEFGDVTGASCQCPCSTDHTFPGGGWPGGGGAGVNWF